MTAQPGRLRSTSLGSVGDSKTPIWANDHVNQRLFSPKKGDDPRVTKMAVSCHHGELAIVTVREESYCCTHTGGVFLLPLSDLVVGSVVNYTLVGLLGGTTSCVAASHASAMENGTDSLYNISFFLLDRGFSCFLLFRPG